MFVQVRMNSGDENPTSNLLPPTKQLDLFRDGRSARLSNALRLALLNEDAEEAANAYHELADFDADHHWLPPAKTLISALRTPAPINEEEGLTVMAHLEADWQEAAEAILGDDRRDMLYRKWRELADALAERPFDPESPEHHASHAYAMCEDWPAVERCILAVPDFMSKPDLLARMAEAVWHQKRPKDAVTCWFSLCWSAPDCFRNLSESGGIPYSDLREGWERWRDQDLAAETSPSWFPAWMLIHNPNIAEWVPVPPAGGDPQAAFVVLRELTIGTGEDVELRKQLQRLHPGLLKSFLKHRQTERRCARPPGSLPNGCE